MMELVSLFRRDEWKVDMEYNSSISGSLTDTIAKSGSTAEHGTRSTISLRSSTLNITSCNFNLSFDFDQNRQLKCQRLIYARQVSTTHLSVPCCVLSL